MLQLPKRRLLVAATVGVVVSATTLPALAATSSYSTTTAVHALSKQATAAVQSAAKRKVGAVVSAPRVVRVNRSLTASISASVLPKGDKVKKVTIGWGDKSTAGTTHSLSAHLKHTYTTPAKVSITVAILDVHGHTYKASTPVTVSPKPGTAAVAGAVQANASDVQAVTTSKSGVQQLVVTGGPKPVVGKPYIVPVSKALPSGVFGKVTKIGKAAGGGTAVTVSPTDIDAVYDHFVSDKTTTLGSSGAFVTSTETGAVQHPAFAQAHLATGLSPLSFLPFVCTAKGKTVHRIDVNLNKVVVSEQHALGLFDSPIFLQLELKGPVTATLTAGFKEKAVCQLSPKIAIVIPIIGPLGLKIQPILKLEGDGSITVATTVVESLDVAMYVGSDGTSLTHTATTSVVNVAVDGKATLTGTVGLAVGLTLGGIVTVGGEIDAVARAEVTTPGNPDANGHDTGTVCVSLDGFIQGSLFVDLNLIVKDFRKNFAYFKLSPVLAIAKGCHENAAPAPTPTPPGGTPTPTPTPPTPSTPTSYAFGSNNSGALGSGSAAATSLTPTGVAGGHTFKQIVGSALDGYGLTPTGDVYAWGSNVHEELGQPGQTSLVPVLVPLPLPATAIASSATANGAYALLNNGTVYYWGDNSTGQGGQGTSATPTARGGNVDPVQVQIPSVGTSSIIAIAATGGSGYALTDSNLDNGTVYAWGANDKGQLGNGSTDEDDAPAVVNTKGNPLRYVSAIFPGGDKTLFLTVDGDTEAMGDNSVGQYGNGSTTSTNNATPDVAAALPDTPDSSRAIAVVNNTTYAIQDGIAYAWGSDDKGQLGDGKTATDPTGGAIAGLSGKTITAVSGSSGTGYARGSDGTIYAYGGDSAGQLGNGTTSSAAGSGVVTVSGPKATVISGGGSTGYFLTN